MAAKANGGEGLRKIAKAARRSQYYRSRPRLDPEREEPVAIETYLADPDQFRDPAARALPPATFSWDRPLGSRVAVIEAIFREEGDVRVFAEPFSTAVSRYAPQTLAAPADVLQDIVDAGGCIPSVEHGIVSFSGPTFGVLTDELRESLWRAFGVPVWNQFRGLKGELLAEECDARGGLHLREEAAKITSVGTELLLTSFLNREYPVLRLATGLAGEVIDRPCACGSAAPRLCSLRPVSTATSLKSKARASSALSLVRC